MVKFLKILMTSVFSIYSLLESSSHYQKILAFHWRYFCFISAEIQMISKPMLSIMALNMWDGQAGCKLFSSSQLYFKK